jgi:hypothetical protein
MDRNSPARCLEVESDAAALPFLHGYHDMSFNVWHYKNVSRYKSRIVAKVEGHNYRFIYAGSNTANNCE